MSDETRLSKKQKDVIIMLLQGYRAKEIATFLDVSDSAIKHRILSFRNALNAKTTIQAVGISLCRGHITVADVDQLSTSRKGADDD